MPTEPFSLRRLTLPQAVLFGLVVMGCTIDFSRQISIAGVSGLGALTLVAAGAVWSAWLLRPVLPKGLLPIFLPLILFVLDSMGTLLWYRPGMDGVQLLLVGTTTLGAMMLAARESAADPALAGRLRTMIMATSVFPVFGWLGVLLSGRVSGVDTNLTRPFALYVLTVIAVTLATWRGSAWPEWIDGRPAPRKHGFKWLMSFWPVAWTIFVAFVVGLGLSRTALVIIALLIPLCLIYRGNFKGISAGAIILFLGGSSFAALLFSYQPLYDRFFKEDASLKVGGVSINGSGRAHIWALLLNTIHDDWPFGKGVSASEDIINKYLPNIGQPHNDYLRFFYDEGVLGLSLWLIFVTGFTARTMSNLRRSIRNQTPDYVQHLAALLALTAVSLSMLTDNSYCYAFVMFPLAIVMGSSLGLGWHYQKLEREMNPPMESAFFEPVPHLK